jgi:hypothetical protein
MGAPAIPGRQKASVGAQLSISEIQCFRGAIVKDRGAAQASAKDQEVSRG